MNAKDFLQKVNNLPLTVREVMLTNKTAETILDISNKHKLELKQIDKLSKITGKIIVKDIPLNEFVNNLKTQVNLEEKKAKSLASDIIQNIFLPIKQHFSDTEALMKKLKSSSMPVDEPNVVNLKKEEEKKE